MAFNVSAELADAPAASKNGLTILDDSGNAITAEGSVTCTVKAADASGNETTIQISVPP